MPISEKPLTAEERSALKQKVKELRESILGRECSKKVDSRTIEGVVWRVEQHRFSGPTATLRSDYCVLWDVDELSRKSGKAKRKLSEMWPGVAGVEREILSAEEFEETVTLKPRFGSAKLPWEIDVLQQAMWDPFSLALGQQRELLEPDPVCMARRAAEEAVKQQILDEIKEEQRRQPLVVDLPPWAVVGGRFWNGTAADLAAAIEGGCHLPDKEKKAKTAAPRARKPATAAAEGETDSGNPAVQGSGLTASDLSSDELPPEKLPVSKRAKDKEVGGKAAGRAVAKKASASGSSGAKRKASRAADDDGAAKRRAKAGLSPLQKFCARVGSFISGSGAASAGDEATGDDSAAHTSAEDLSRQPEAWYPPGHQLLPQQREAAGSGGANPTSRSAAGSQAGTRNTDPDDEWVVLPGDCFPKKCLRSQLINPGDTELKNFIDIDFEGEEFTPTFIVSQRPKDAPTEYLIKWENFEVNPHEWTPYELLLEEDEGGDLVPKEVLQEWEAAHPPPQGAGNPPPTPPKKKRKPAAKRARRRS